MTTKLKESLAAKAAAFLLLIVTSLLAMTSGLGGVIMVETSLLTQPQQVINNALEDVGYEDAYHVFHLYENEGQTLDALPNSNASFQIVKQDGTRVAGNDKGQETPYHFTYHFKGIERNGPENAYNSNGSDHIYVERANPSSTENDAYAMYKVTLYVDPAFPVNDKYKTTFEWANWSVTTLTDIGYGIFAIAGFSALATIGCFVFLLCSAGHRKGAEGIVAGPLVRKLPFDLLTAIVLTAECFLLFFSVEGMDAPSEYLTILIMAVCFLFALILGTLYCMNFAVRVKLGRWWENTLLFRFGRSFLGFCKKMLNEISWLLHRLPLIWKTVLFCAVFALASLIVIMISSTGARATLWLFAMLVLLPAFLYLALMLRSLQSASRALASGDLTYQVDTTRMVWDFKDAGENLNQISSGMTLAVEERLKSERFKTELITNVSHDIKTPLTSIINYADLIAKEEAASETLKEYSAVLLRQSERLKKLLEDLVEASKASTGNLEVHLAPCELDVLLTQTAGEYGQKLEAKNLPLIVKGEDTPIKIMADGRLLWRVFDNLMTNVLKYAQSGTRVYLTLEKQEGKVLISFKNTSSYALDVPAEELLERFARGDTARHTEGNGLGLSIAQSLTELQGGTLSLTVDGDLFKVTLRFQTIS